LKTEVWILLIVGFKQGFNQKQGFKQSRLGTDNQSPTIDTNLEQAHWLLFCKSNSLFVTKNHKKVGSL
jgi:hypothetical protein